MNDISRAAEVHNHGYRAGRESFEDYATAEIANRRKHQHVRRS